MHVLQFNRRFHRTVFTARFIVSLLAFLIVMPLPRAHAQRLWEHNWPPELHDIYALYPDWKPGDTLVKPIDARVMREMATAVLDLGDGALAHVDSFIKEASHVKDPEPLDSWLVDRGFGPVRDHLRNTRQDWTSSINEVRAEMQRQHNQVKQIAQRYENPAEVPGDPAAYKALLEKQTADAKALSSAVQWFMDGRAFVAQWVLDSLYYMDADLEEYHRQVNNELNPKVDEIAQRTPDWDSLDEREQLDRKVEVFMKLRTPYAAQEKILVDQCVNRYLRLAEKTHAAFDEISVQLHRFVDSAPEEWAKIPFCYDLFIHISKRIDGFIPREHTMVSPNTRVLIWVSYYTPDDIETPYATAKFDEIWIELEGQWPYRLPALEDVVANAAKEAAKPTYPKYTVYRPPTVPRVTLWGNGIPEVGTDELMNLLSESVIEEQSLDSRCIIMAVYGQNLFDVELETPELSWAPGDRHLEYVFLHSGTYAVDKVNGFEDSDWHDLWRALDGRVDGLTKHSDVYFVAVRLAPNTWAGPYEFKLGDLRVRWTLAHATNIAHTRFVRHNSAGGEILDDDEEYEQIIAVFKHDQFHVEIVTSGDVLTDSRIPFELMVSHAGGDAKAVAFGANNTTFFAYRIHNDRRLFRSKRIIVGPSTRSNEWRERDGQREAMIALRSGDRLTARVVPHGVARQGIMEIARVNTAPADVGAHWRPFVIKAAQLADVTPPQPWERLSSEDFNRLLRTEWETVDSTPFVQVGGRDINLTLGDLAAMLLVRENFISSMQAVLPDLRAMRDDPNLSRSAFGILQGDATTPANPIGDILVPMWDVAIPELAFDAVHKTPLRNVYNEQWLEQNFHGVNPWKWQQKAATYAFKYYVEAAEDSLKHAVELDVTDAEDLLRLTTIGMGRLTDNIKPNLLRLVETSDDAGRRALQWEVDTVARGYVGSIGSLGREFIANEALIEQYDALTLIVVASTGILAPEAIAAQVAAAIVNLAPMAVTLAHNVPEYFSRRNDVRLALGAYQAIGQERYIASELRAIPGWAIALELAGGSLDIVASVAQLRHARSAWVALKADEEIVEIFEEGTRAFAALPREDQKSALIRVAQLSEMRTAGKTLTELESTILERGTQTIDDLGTFGQIPSPEYVNPDLLETLDPIVLRDGSIGFISPDELADAAHAAAPAMGPSGTPVVADDIVAGPPLRIHENEPWHIFDVRERIGHGAYAQVYEVGAAEGGRRALKVYAEGTEGIEDVQRALRAQQLLEDADIHQLRIIDHGVAPDGKAYIVQEYLPAPGIYQPAHGVQMPEDMQKALLELYKKMAKSGLAWSDGYSANVYFFRQTETGPLMAGVLDQDRVWTFGQGLHTGVFNEQALNTTLFILRQPNDRLLRGSRMWSLKESTYTPSAYALLDRGYCPWPNNEYLMMKMLEHRGWIRYSPREGRFVSDHMSIELVEDAFPRLNHPESINSHFDIPEHLRERAREILPDDLLRDSRLPDWRPVPWIDSAHVGYRVAA